MASSLVYRTLKSIRIPNPIRVLTTSSLTHHLSSTAAVHQQTQSDDPSSSFTFSPSSSNENDESIFIKGPKEETTSLSSITMSMSFMIGSIVGRRFYKQVTTREADDRNGWMVMLDYRTLKTPSKRALKLPTFCLAKAIGAEWDYKEIEGIRPFTMPLMRLLCTALERVPLTRPKIIEYLMMKFNQDQVFCRAPSDNELTSGVHGGQMGSG